MTRDAQTHRKPCTHLHDLLLLLLCPHARCRDAGLVLRALRLLPRHVPLQRRPDAPLGLDALREHLLGLFGLLGLHLRFDPRLPLEDDGAVRLRPGLLLLF